MFDLLYKAGMIEVIQNETAVARIYPYNNYYLVKILQSGYDFQTESIDTALKIISEKVGR